MMLERLSLLRTVAYARERLQYADRRELPRLLVKFVADGLGSRIWKRTELRVYVCSAERARAMPKVTRFRRDCWHDLECYERSAFHDQLGKDEFLRVAERRLQTRQHVYTLAEGGALLHYAWLAERQDFAPDANIPDVKLGLAFLPPEGSALVWDFFTHPHARGRGLMQQSLCQSVRDAVELAGAQRVYGYVFSHNLASARAVEKVGFQHAGSLFRDVRLGRVRRYAVPRMEPFEVRPL
jgi:RimJ/RimL family protein N-acetyltransferase